MSQSEVPYFRFFSRRDFGRVHCGITDYKKEPATDSSASLPGTDTLSGVVIFTKNDKKQHKIGQLWQICFYDQDKIKLEYLYFPVTSRCTLSSKN